MNSIMNMQSIAALLFVLGIVWRSRSPRTAHTRDGESFSRRDVLLVAALAAVAGLAFLRTADAPFLHDSNSHVMAAAARSWKETFRIFCVHPAAGDFFYRPIGYLSYSIDSKWAGFLPVRWHIWNMALHGLNSGLVYYLARLLALSRAPSLGASLVFALHGTRPEAVSWVAGSANRCSTRTAVPRSTAYS